MLSAILRYLQQHAKCCVRQYNDKLESHIFTSLYSTLSARQQLGLEKISVIEKTTLVNPDRQLVSVSSYVIFLISSLTKTSFYIFSDKRTG